MADVPPAPLPLMTAADYSKALADQCFAADAGLLAAVVAEHRKALTPQLICRVHGKYLRAKAVAANSQDTTTKK